MKILVTGSAGFIGSALTLKLLERGDTVIGVDNHNDYYDPSLKEARLARHIGHPNYTHLRIDLADKDAMDECFAKHNPRRVVNLAGQAGVRYSTENPCAYINSNIVGFAHVLEGCRLYGVEHLVYASSSSVYGANTKLPFSIHHNVDHPLSLYAATKKSNELMAHSYSHIYKLPTTGLRLFTVYGPWSRPDMALCKFTKAILSNQKIELYNYGKHRRDFTYIDDIVQGIILTLDRPASTNANWSGDTPDCASSTAPWRIYNLGNSAPVKLLDYVSALEDALGKKADKELQPMQPGDVPDTFAEMEDLISEFGYKPSTTVNHGVAKFVEWYRQYFGV